MEQIKTSIDLGGNDLDRNVRELDDKMKTAVDWRSQFQRKPVTAVGIGAGFLVSQFWAAWPVAF